MPAQFFWKVLGVFVNLGGGQSLDEVGGKLLCAVGKSHTKKLGWESKIDTDAILF